MSAATDTEDQLNRQSIQSMTPRILDYIIQRTELKTPDLEPKPALESSIEKSELHSTKPQNQQHSLLALPTELIHYIIEHVQDISRDEADDIRDRRLDRVDHTCCILRNRQHFYYTACHHSSPILNSLQSLAVVSRAIYNLCRPWLWRVS